MSLGCPVAASNRAALPEVAGDAAVLFDPEDTAAAAAAIVRAIDDRERLTVAGFQRAQWFTWERCAERHTEIYRTVVSQDRARRRP
jgi:alpha-1,3-rhamnosyl/mannosyltransferase